MLCYLEEYLIRYTALRFTLKTTCCLELETSENMPNYIPFNTPYLSGNEIEYIESSLKHRKLSGGQHFSSKCSAWFEGLLGSTIAIPTPSCTAALEMGLMVIDIKPGDEVILPSYTFTSTATSIVLNGGTPVFIDIEPNTLNINADLIEAAISERTRAIIPVHYNGVSCDMDKIMKVANDHKLYVLEDAAQCIYAKHGNSFIGSEGHMSAFSFHETKNINSGEGGMLCINDKTLVNRAEVIRDKGTNRQEFLRGEIDKYSWKDKGSSYLLSDPQCAFLLSQLEKAKTVKDKRKQIWNTYSKELRDLKELGKIEFADYSKQADHNAHLFYICLPSPAEAEKMRQYLIDNNIQAVSHYVPLHSSEAGLKFGRVASTMEQCNDIPHRLLRLPLFFDLTIEQAKYISDKIKDYFLKG